MVELRPYPVLFKTRLCSKFSGGGSCPKGAQCRFAHGEGELRSTEGDGSNLSSPEIVAAGANCPATSQRPAATPTAANVQLANFLSQNLQQEIVDILLNSFNSSCQGESYFCPPKCDSTQALLPQPLRPSNQTNGFCHHETVVPAVNCSSIGDFSETFSQRHSFPVVSKATDDDNFFLESNGPSFQPLPDAGSEESLKSLVANVVGEY